MGTSDYIEVEGSDAKPETAETQNKKRIEK